MDAEKTYDTLILGSGEAGKTIAWNVAATGRRVAVVERRYVGGSCPNIACLPSKNIVHSAKVADLLRRHDQFGLRGGGWTMDMVGVRDRKRRMVEGLVEMHRQKFQASGAELIMGEGRLVGARTIEVTAADGSVRQLRGERLVLCLGSRAAIGPTPGLREAAPMTHIDLLEIDVVPAHLIILGGGYVGLEFAQAMRRFGSRVTVVERNSLLIHREDPDVSEAVEAIFNAEGIELAFETKVDRVSGRSGKSVTLHGIQRGQPFTMEGSHLLVATGRVPNTDGIGLDAEGVKTTARGFVQVDDQLRTTAANVWAVGDGAGSPQFTHVSYDDYRIVAAQLLGTGPRTTAGRLVPSCMFIDPELARVGLSETDATHAGIPYRLAKIPMKAILRTWTLDETTGFLKALIGDDDRVLGFTCLGTGAGEIMAIVQLAMQAGLPYTQLRDMIATHPTLAEGVVPLFSSVPAR